MIGIGKLWNDVGGRGSAGLKRSTLPRQAGAPETTLIAPSSACSDPLSSDTRVADRFVPNKTSTMLTTWEGRRVAARIINISRMGVAVEAEFSDCGPGDIVMVGKRPVMAGRAIALGTVFLFEKPLDPKLCDPKIVL